MNEQLEKIKKEILDSLSNIKDSNTLRELEIKYLGRKGEFTEILRGLSALGEEERKTFGKLVNDVKTEIMGKFSAAKDVIEGTGKTDEFLDVTVPGKKIATGHIHPITQTQEELGDLFSSMGFMILDGPELESDFYNFEALNIPSHHPARDMQDTFYVSSPTDKEGKNDLVMRTHTSPMQVRAMQKYGAPLRAVVPGRVFRNEEIDACHDHTFDQMEGLMIDEGISMDNLIAVMKKLINGIFGRTVETRIRPGYFPFVEPGIELDIKCTICGGKGCPSCKHGGWLELMPGGMVHPNVLRAGGIDPEKYSGFAFGLGLTRLVMMKYGVEDIRLFNGGDMRFLEQF
jgi:phenylalanyl-tRNA synthetase alpha chain